ncbi:hypothetical protein, partial [Escherichia coli]|uniref:hypothetical protein n=1 Tax=Escherichia coli TaxID=562 RepID=UPI0021B2B36B
MSIKNDGHYFCRAGGNRPDGLNEPVTCNTGYGLIVSNLEEKFHDFMGVILMVLGDESNTSRRFCRII